MTGINHTDRGHSKVGASSSERWMNCHASVSLIDQVEAEQGRPLDTRSSAADEGTAAHELGETCLVDGTEAEEYVGTKINGYLVTEEMAEAVQIYVDYVRSFTETPAYTNGQISIFLEEQFTLDHIDPECFGSNDAAIVEEFGTLTIIDYKHGAGVDVSPKENTQLMYYASALVRQSTFKEVHLVIVQPRSFESKDKPIKIWKTTPERIYQFEDEVREALKKVRGPNPQFKVTEKGCKFCAVKGRCPEMAKQATDMARLAFKDNLDVSSGDIKDRIKNLTPQEVSKILNMSKALTEFLKEVKSHAKDMAERGVKIEGYKLVEGKSRRQWIDPEATVEELSFLFDEDDLFEPRKLKTPAQLEKIVGKKSVEELCQKVTSGRNLVTEDSKGKEVKPKVVEAFEDFLEVENFDEENFDDL